jgi:predicted dehydrogenase
MRLVIIGHGSIGKRHHRNAVSLGVPESAIKIVDPAMTVASSLKKALASRPDAVCICTPLRTHYEIAQKVLTQTTASLFVEKPLCAEIDQARELVELAQGRVAQVGYCWRFHRTVISAMDDIRKALQSGKRPTHLKLTCHSCRSLWPGLAYTYGDVIYEASHEIDLALHFLGASCVKFASVEQSSALISLSASRKDEDDLDIDCDLKYVSHPDQERRVINVRWNDGTVSAYNLRKPPSAIAPMYIAELKDFFLSVASRKQSTRAASFADGARVVEIINHAEEKNVLHS